jgi:hypothetical protein
MRESSQKVLCLLYDPKNLSDASHRIYEPQNLTLISDLSGVGQGLAPKRAGANLKQSAISGEGDEGSEAAGQQAARMDKR